jgi:hypothetical protein
MSENKKLIYWILGIFSATFLLIVGVMAHDRGIDIAIVDHLFHFHVDEHAIREELDRMTHEKADKDARREEWVNDIRGCWRDNDDYGRDVGTVGPPDRDR